MVIASISPSALIHHFINGPTRKYSDIKSQCAHGSTHSCCEVRLRSQTTRTVMRRTGDSDVSVLIGFVDRLPDPNRVAASQSTLTSPILENVSHGQLQTRSSVPFDFAMTFVVYLKAIDGHGEAMGLSVAKSGDDGGAVDRGGGRQWWCTEVSDMDRRKKERRKNSDGGQLVVCGGDDER
ncbi:hypothetical protein HKD37_08G021097 [Glycine soja]